MNKSKLRVLMERSRWWKALGQDPQLQIPHAKFQESLEIQEGSLKTGKEMTTKATKTGGEQERRCKEYTSGIDEQRNKEGGQLQEVELE